MRRLLSIAMGVLFAHTAMAQDVHFSQFYSSPLHLNPAFTGAGVCNRVSTNYRSQWMGVPNGYKSYLLSIDHFMQDQSMGIGFMFSNDVAGTGKLKRTEFNPLLAYEARISPGAMIRAGFKPTLGLVSINFDDLIFGDQIVRGGNVTTVENPAQNVAYFDIGVGGLIMTEKAWFGVAADHLLSPAEGLVLQDGTDRLPLKISAHGGYKHFLEGDEKDVTKQKTMTFAFNYRGQGPYDQLDLGFYYTYNVINFGLWYRGLPGVKAYQPGYGNSDAMAILIGVKNHRMNFGYSYDFTISKLANNNSGGANEISFAIQLCNPKKRRRKPRSFTPCPSF